MGTPSSGAQWIKNPWIVFGAVIGIWLVFGVCLFAFIRGKDAEEKRGQFGDMFGAVNALFSGLALGGIIYTISLQRQELELQRQELQLSREELSQQTKVFAQQLQAMQESLSFERRTQAAANQPFFHFHGAHGDASRRRYLFKNNGASVHNVSVEPQSGVVASEVPTSIPPGEEMAFCVGFPPNKPVLSSFDFTIHYTTQIGEAGQKKFRVEGEGLPTPYPSA